MSAVAYFRQPLGYVMATKIVEGSTYGRLTVTALHPVVSGTRRFATCRCVCGSVVRRRVDSLQRDGVVSCGCYSREFAAAVITKRNKDTATHKMTGTMEHRCWHSMMQRCYNKGQKAYPHYGGSGVVVCQFLKESPRNLMVCIGAWSKANSSLDRFPVLNGNYTCGTCQECVGNGWRLNVRWTTRKGQSENRSNNVFIVAFGRKLLRSQWQELTGLSSETVRSRLDRHGWTVERSLTTPDKQGNCYRPTDEEWRLHPDGTGRLEKRCCSRPSRN